MTAPTAALIPAYQAAPWVADVAAGCASHVDRVLVVDDGSTDDTAEAARGGGAEVVVLETNRGKAAALRTGFARLFDEGASHVVTVDADGQHLPEEIPRLLEAPAELDLVLGTRSHLFDGMSRLRRSSNRWSSGLISLAAGIPVADVQTGFRRYGSDLWRAVGLPGERFAAESAIVVLAARRGFSVGGVPVRLGRVDGRSSSHYRPLADSLRIARAVLRARWASA